MSEAGFWIAWGLPTQGREPQALETLKKSRGFLADLAADGRIERYDVVILRPQSSELGGFILVQGSTAQIDQLRRDADFERWLNVVQAVADRVGIVDAWVNDGIDEATDLYTDALREAGLID